MTKKNGRRKKRDITAEADKEADKELDLALKRLSKAMNEHGTVSQNLHRRQSSGGFKVVPTTGSMPSPT